VEGVPPWIVPGHAPCEVDGLCPQGFGWLEILAIFVTHSLFGMLRL
jgi:hypothetical protein